MKTVRALLPTGALTVISALLKQDAKGDLCHPVKDRVAQLQQRSVDDVANNSTKISIDSSCSLRKTTIDVIGNRSR
ncbi:MAG: hypothetical protein ACLVJ6_06655 [Merdibacter sp.]